MDVRGLKLPDSISKFFQKNKSLFPLLLVVSVVALLVLGAWWLAPYYDEVYALLPGFYDDTKYNELRDEKNELIDENVELLADVEEMEESLQEIETTQEGYAKSIEMYADIVSVQESVRDNLQRIVELDEEILGMRLPDVVTQYVEVSYELDKVRLELIELALEITRAQSDLAELNKLRTEFDNCLADVNWADEDAEISSQVTACVAKIEPIQKKVTEMESSYDVELEQMTEYLTLLKEEWEASAAYYLAISQSDYAKANEHDAVFVDRKGKISELNVVAVFGEFYEDGIEPMLDEFNELKELEVEKEDQTDEWYRRNLER